MTATKLIVKLDRSARLATVAKVIGRKVSAPILYTLMGTFVCHCFEQIDVPATTESSELTQQMRIMLKAEHGDFELTEEV